MYFTISKASWKPWSGQSTIPKIYLLKSPYPRYHVAFVSMVIKQWLLLPLFITDAPTCVPDPLLNGHTPLLFTTVCKWQGIRGTDLPASYRAPGPPYSCVTSLHYVPRKTNFEKIPWRGKFFNLSLYKTFGIRSFVVTENTGNYTLFFIGNSVAKASAWDFGLIFWLFSKIIDSSWIFWYEMKALIKRSHLNMFLQVGSAQFRAHFRI